ncbi:hypothetical protein SAMN05216511_7339 [Streptomyces sp. KS_16]|nr:hypothetical protein BX261_7364 [Streptomyces sp. 2321.6]SDR62316.1 hypothetical protein SAMN05216511_7339 [Streptomyces sp. KS_16]SNC77784.1 hypothetical protein SAMN06272741_7200 [Streptomyces sp. 2114.4]
MTRLGRQGRIRGSPGNAKTAGSSQLAGRPKRNTTSSQLAAQFAIPAKEALMKSVPKAVLEVRTTPSHMTVILRTAEVPA